MNSKTLLLRRSFAAAAATAVLLGAGTAAAATYCYDLSGPAVGTTYAVGDSLTPTGATAEFKRFQWDSGTWFAGGSAEIVANNAAGGVASELNLNNINLRIIPDTPAYTASYKYADFGGNMNLGVNGDLRNTNDLMTVDGTVVGGCDVEVTQTNFVGLQVGEVEIICAAPEEIEMFGIGGQEFFVDDICFEN
ncbi:MAG: hypothetical protein ACRBN8_19610 [Nannocystales bacterium]